MTHQFEPYPVPEPPAARISIEVGLGPYETWDCIAITGIRATGTHGVYSEEKTTPQLFVVDLTLWASTEAAATSDSLDDTIDYVAVSRTAARIVSAQSFDLIEKLADVIATELLALAGPHQAVSVTVHKPQAAQVANAADIAVTMHRHAKVIP